MKSPSLTVRFAPLDRKLAADALLIPVLVQHGKPQVGRISGLDDAVAARLDELAEHFRDRAQPGAIDDHLLPKQSKIRRVALISLGETDPPDHDDVRNAAGALVEWANRHRLARVAISLDALRAAAGDNGVAPWVEGLALGAYRYVDLRSKLPDTSKTTLESVQFVATRAAPTRIKKSADHAAKLCEAVNLARTIGHEPPNVINPVTLAKRCQGLARKYKLRCTVIDDRQMKTKKMGAFLAVGAGSASKPRLIALEHRGSRPKARPIVLVGKAITLDTGGYSIKPAASIPDMKYDKCGGMAVIGALVAAALLKLPHRIIGIVGAAENMISADAYRPGDIVTAMNGTTIEILNTDAEGRLVLADCLHYAETAYKPAAMIDLATLTGACIVALGESCAGLMGNDDKLADDLLTAGERTGECCWRLPLWANYREQIAGTDGDIKNVGGRPAGAITAAKFLEEFVDAKTPWAHLDIAGVANITKATPTCPIGATGFGVRLLIDYIENRR